MTPHSDPAKNGRRTRLLDVAATLLNARGVSSSTLSDVAAALSVSRASLYYYVRDVEDLTFQVYRRSCETLLDHLDRAASNRRNALEIVHAIVARALDPDEVEIAALSEIGLLRAENRREVLGLYEEAVSRLVSILAQGAMAGELRQCDFDTIARSIISVIYWIPLADRWTTTAGSVSRVALIEAICEIMTNGLVSNRQTYLPTTIIDLDPLLGPAIAAFDRGALNQGKREAILACASRLFNAKGVDGTSLEEIAAELSATKRTLYHYIGDKKQIVAACYARAFSIYSWPRHQAQALGLDPVDALFAEVRANNVAQQRRDLAPLRPYVGFDAMPPEEQAAARERSIEMTSLSRKELAGAQKTGRLRKLDPDLILLILPGVSTWLAKDLISPDPTQQARIADEITKLIKIGLSPLN